MQNAWRRRRLAFRKPQLSGQLGQEGSLISRRLTQAAACSVHSKRSRGVQRSCIKPLHRCFDPGIPIGKFLNDTGGLSLGHICRPILSPDTPSLRQSCLTSTHTNLCQVRQVANTPPLRIDVHSAYKRHGNFVSCAGRITRTMQGWQDGLLQRMTGESSAPRVSTFQALHLGESHVAAASVNHSL